MKLRWFSALSFALGVALLAGCGSGGGGNGGGVQATPVKMTVNWAARSRADAPSSALSFRATLKQASPDGSDLTFGSDRNDAPAAYSQTYTFPNQAKVGTWQLEVTFFAQKGGQGDVVGTAQAMVTLNPDGTGIGDIATNNTVASIEVQAGQSLRAGETKNLIFTARDANHNVVAVTPGSAFWQVTAGADKLQLTPDGKATGQAEGKATVTATVDGKTSPAADVTVTATFTATFTDVFNQVVALECIGCHNGSSSTLPGSMDLSTQDKAYAAWANVDSIEMPALKRVKPGDSANSWVYQKVTQDDPGVGTKMPPFKTLGQDQIALLKAWIDAGAKNN